MFCTKYVTEMDVLDIVKRSQILFEFDALLTHVDTLLVNWQNFVQASLFAFFVFVCTLLMCFYLKMTERLRK